MKNLLLILLCFSASIRAEKDTLSVSVSEFPPFIIFAEGSITGFDIDLWTEIASGLGQPFRWQSTKNLSEVFNQVKSGQSDIGLAGITITSERETDFDFSHPYFTTGLNVLVPSYQQNPGVQFLKSIFTSRVQKILFSIVLFIIGCSHLIWFFERGQNAIHDRYFPGIFEGAWWTIVTMSTVGYGDIAPKNWAGRIIAVFVILMGITFFGIAVAELSSSFTKQNTGTNINSVHDLKNLKVAVLKGTTSEEESSRLGITAVTVENIAQAFHKLDNRKVAAILADEPLLRYRMKLKKGNYRLLEPFRSQPYGLLLKSGNNLREKVNKQILKLKESGRYQNIYDKWFDSVP